MNVLNYHSNENGFTLMELMIVIAIISILSSVAIPAYQGYIQKAALTDVLQTLSPYRSAIELCRYENDPQHCNSDSTFMPQQFRSRYLSDINVLNGVISATGKSQLDGLTITMSPEKGVNDLIPVWKTQCSAANLTLQKQCSEILKSY
ncbi:prepilin peptidase-dependent pilin [Proteus sp. WDL240414]|uniref:Prepilin peptidase-dependent pilin n=2 Tax=Proteus TaxID=583 RepID=A0A6I7D302_9GAMM|nr:MULTISPECIES: prepilin peptidase-dependent pilin [Proteus]MBG2800800.1 prepilin peptidase-dependent pilin [Proteus mirabilis]MBG3020575.1 prepilin peptidase-dependent pilin [Proteus mirabilis]MBG3151972.1 prepilin peptidase-dependent pilin [Proteus mirabilis]QHN11431.1 prepilin peptidase-dependent pilin [Proteus columbae]